jgi:chromosome segregation ATPase
MAQSQRASMRSGPLAELFRSTLDANREDAIERARVPAPGADGPATARAPIAAPADGIEVRAAGRATLEADLRSAESRTARDRGQERALAETLESMEAQLMAARRWMDRAMERAHLCLNEVEARADQASRLAARAEELATRMTNYADQEQRLRATLNGIAEAERRASRAEASVHESVSRVGELTYVRSSVVERGGQT